MQLKEIVVVDYNPEWPAWYSQVESHLEQALGELAIAIEHVGSTSVPSLCSKAVIDVDIVIDDSQFDAVKEALTAAGYAHKGDLGLPGRESFDWEGETPMPPHHLYVCDKDNRYLREHLEFRGILREREDLREEYGNLKLALAERFRTNRRAYCNSKSAFVQRVLNLYQADMATAG